ncbi:MAG: hypothetical protein ACKOXB_12595 [Flavobacteriales bacterium]
MNQKFNIDNGKIKPGFSVPENYFNELEVNIQNKISRPQKPWISRYKYVVSGAATAIIGVTVWWLQPNPVAPVAVKVAPVQSTDYALYINENIEEFDDDLLYESYAEASTPTSARAAEDEAYSSYLIDEDIDENTLIDEL